MKKVIWAMACAALIGSSLIACGGDSSTVGGDGPGNETKETTMATEKETEALPLAPGVLYDKDGVKVTFKELTYDAKNAWWGVHVNVVNDTDNEIRVRTDMISFNGMICGGAGGISDCAAKSSVDDVWEFNNYDVIYNVAAGGLKQVSQVGVEPIVSIETESGGTTYDYGQMVTVDVEPHDIAFASETFSFYKKSSQTVFENDCYEVTCLGIADDFANSSGKHPCIYFRIDNKSGQPISVSYDETYVDYADIIEALDEDEQCYVNGQICTSGLFIAEDISAYSSVIFCASLRVDDLGLSADEIVRYQKAFEIRGRYDLAPGTVEDCVFVADITFE